MPEDIWSDLEVSATLNEIGLSAGADAALPDEVRFVRRVHEVLVAAEARHGPMSAPTVYVYAPIRESVVPETALFHPRIHRGEVDPSGQLWFVGAAARSGHSVALGSQSAREIFEQTVELGFGNAPAVYCDTHADPSVFAWYPSGVEEADDVIEGPIHQVATPTLDDLIEVVEGVYRTRLMTTLNQGADTSLWEDGTKHRAHERAEKRVQDALMAGLGGRFGRPYFVEQERPANSGRFDIGFREQGAGGASTLHAILELKVTRSYGSGGASVGPGQVEQHVVDGVEQARAYSDEHGASNAACLVFDLRVPDKQVPPAAAVARAAALDVFLQFWRCFAIAVDYRKFKLPDAT